VNESVSGPDSSAETTMKRDDTDDEFDDYYHHTHANFLVTRNVGSVCSAPVLFFAELSNDGDDDQLLCCPVDIPPPGAGIYMLPFFYFIRYTWIFINYSDAHITHCLSIYMTWFVTELHFLETSQFYTTIISGCYR
jgi:hypothetical protein